MVAYAKPQQRRKEECKRLRGEEYQIKVIDLGFERWQVAGSRKARRRQDTSLLLDNLASSFHRCILPPSATPHPH